RPTSWRAPEATSTARPYGRRMDLRSRTRLVDHLAGLPDGRAASAPAAPCLDDDRLALTNRTFALRVRATAELLRSHGVGARHVVAVGLPNRVELVVVMF